MPGLIRSRILPVIGIIVALGACGFGNEAPADSLTGGLPGGEGTDDARGAGGGMLGWARDKLASVGADTKRLVPAEVIDESGFGAPAVAMRLQVPAGWQTAGGVRWNDTADCHSRQLDITWAAVAPDEASVIELLPGYVWQVQGTELPVDPCPVAPYRSAREFLEAVASQARPGARVLDYGDWPEQTRKGRQQAERLGHMPAPDMEHGFDAGRLLIAYPADGVDMREVISARLTMVGNTKNGNVVGTASRVVAYRAPDGALDLTLLDRVVDSLEEDPQWFKAAVERIQGNVNRFYAEQLKQIQRWHARRMAEINARGAADRAAIWSQATREIAAMRAQTYANTQATNDRIHARGIDGIYERNAYAGTHGGTVYSSIHGGSRVFQDNSNPANAWSTDDPYAQPSNATELERMR